MHTTSARPYLRGQSLHAMSAIARLAVSSSGRQVVMRLSQPSVAGVRFLQTSQTSRDIDSGQDIQTQDKIFNS